MKAIIMNPLKYWADLFGFSLEHGLALWDVATAVTVGASVVGGMMQDDAAGDAADAQSDSAAAAQQTLQKIDKRTYNDTAPYRGVGAASLYRLSDLLGLDKPYLQSMDQIADAAEPYYASTVIDGGRSLYYNPYTGQVSPSGGIGYIALPNTKTFKAPEVGAWDRDAFKASIAQDYETLKAQPNPEDFGSLMNKFSQADLDKDVVYNKGLQFGLDEGTKAIDRRATALGGYDSGATLKALTKYANDYGETKAGGAYDRFTGDKLNIYNMLMGTTNLGKSAIDTTANTGMQVANATANAQMGAGNARAAGIVGGANAWGGALSSAAGAYGNYQNGQNLKSIFNPGSSVNANNYLNGSFGA
jgi:hypothetical protein